MSVHAGGSALLQKQQRRGRGVCLSVELGTEHGRRAARSSPTSETRLVQMGSVERLYLQHGENNLSAFDDVLRDISCSSDVCHM